MIRQNIKLLCKYRGINLGDLAQRLNITRQTLNSYFTKSPTTATLAKIADALNVPPFVLLHPAPLTALRMMEHQNPAQLQTHQITICPYCHKRIKIQLTQDEQPEE